MVKTITDYCPASNANTISSKDLKADKQSTAEPKFNKETKQIRRR
jgi:hypothetical protein